MSGASRVAEVVFFYILIFLLPLLYIASKARGREREMLSEILQLAVFKFLSITKLLSLFLSFLRWYMFLTWNNTILFFFSSFLWQICVYCSTTNWYLIFLSFCSLSLFHNKNFFSYYVIFFILFLYFISFVIFIISRTTCGSLSNKIK